MKEIAFYNGSFINQSDIKTEVEDRGNTFGDGVYDALSTFNSVPANFDYHINRFYRSMEMIDIKSPYTKDELKKIIKEVIQKTDEPSLVVYFQITRGSEKRSHTYSDGIKPNLYIVARKKTTYKKLRKEGVGVISVTDERWRRCDIKSLNLLPNILAAKKAKQAGCIEAILVRDGYAAECTASNLWYIKDSIIYTEPLSTLILNGVNRQRLFEIAPTIGIKIVEKKSTIEDYYNADEVFITSCTKLMLNITKVDDVELTMSHPVSDKLYHTYVKDLEKTCGKIVSDDV